jgi:hypothetical protein
MIWYPLFPRLIIDKDRRRNIWRRPYVDTHLPVMYRIDVQEPPILDWRPLVSDVTDTSYRVTGLRPTRDYSFRIVRNQNLFHADL